MLEKLFRFRKLNKTIRLNDWIPFIVWFAFSHGTTLKTAVPAENHIAWHYWEKTYPEIRRCFQVATLNSPFLCCSCTERCAFVLAMKCIFSILYHYCLPYTTRTIEHVFRFFHAYRLVIQIVGPMQWEMNTIEIMQLISPFIWSPPLTLW